MEGMPATRHRLPVQAATAHEGRQFSIWHYLLALALLPCLGVAALATPLTTSSIDQAHAAADTERDVVTIQRVGLLHVAAIRESISASVQSALQLMKSDDRSLATKIPTTPLVEARKGTDAALAVLRTDSGVAARMQEIAEAIDTARDQAVTPAGVTTTELAARAWTSIQGYRNVDRLLSSIQSASANAVITGRSGTESSAVLQAATQLQAVSEVTLLGSQRGTDLFLTYLAPSDHLAEMQAELHAVDAAYRIRAAGLDGTLSGPLGRAWDTFSGSADVTVFDQFVAHSIAVGLGRTDTSGLHSDQAAVAKAIAANPRGLVDLLARAAASTTSAAAAEHRHANRRAWLTAALTTLLLALTFAVLLLLGGTIRRRLRDVAASAQRLSSGQLETMHVRGPREIAVVSEGLNDAVGSLQQVSAVAERLAVGDLDSAELSRPVAGALGAAVHTSVELLAQAMRERQRLQDQLSHQASHDTLTGIPNRHEALRVLGAALDREDGRDVAVLFVDLDHFKQVNDVHGHHAGDHVLQLSAARMQAQLRESDIVCRLGGDEFVVIIEGGDSMQVLSMIGQRIVDSIREPIVF